MTSTDVVTRFLAAEGRERKALLAEVLEGADRDRLLSLAPALRDPSPRVSNRLTAAYARQGLKDQFMAAIDGIKPARRQALIRQFERITSTD